MGCRVAWLVNPPGPMVEAAASAKTLVHGYRIPRRHIPEDLGSKYKESVTIFSQKFQYLPRINNITINKARVLEFRCTPDRYFSVISAKDGRPTRLSEFTHRAMISRWNRQHDGHYKRERCRPMCRAIYIS